jgi:hypothetical protein
MDAEGGRVQMPTSVAVVLRDAGVRWTNEGQDARVLSLVFPRA